MIYVIAGLAVAVIGFLIWYAVRERKAGAVAEQAKVATHTVEVQQRMDVAAAEAPHDRAGVENALDKGSF